MASLYSYVPSKVEVKIFGIELVGLAKDSFISIERIDNSLTFRKAMDGSHTAFVDEYGTYRVTINLSQVSESNEFLHIIQKLYTITRGNVKMPLTISEKSSKAGVLGATSFLSLDTFFENEPSSEYGADVGARSWVFICNNAHYAVRGTSDTGLIADSLRYVVKLIDMYGIAESVLGGTSQGASIKRIIEDSVVKAENKLKEMF